MSKFNESTLYAIRFKNGEDLHHQSPLQLAQFRNDARVSTFWVEFDPTSNGPSGFKE